MVFFHRPSKVVVNLRFTLLTEFLMLRRPIGPFIFPHASSSSSELTELVLLLCGGTRSPPRSSIFVGATSLQLTI